jgi:mannosyltransferase
MQEPDLIVTCLKQRYTGVSATVDALLPALAGLLNVGYVGSDLAGAERAQALHPGTFRRLGLIEAIRVSARRRARPGRLVWHVRRNHELLLAVLLRDVARLPIRVLFTSAAIRRHSAIPRWLIARADAVIATSDRAAALVPNVAAVVPHGIDTARLAPGPGRERAWHESGLPGRHGIVIAGRVREEKGIRIFVDAMTRLLPSREDWCAVIVGRCKPEDAGFVAACRSRISEAGLQDRIRFVGEATPDEMARWFARSTIAVACPLYEGFGLTVIEAMACGCAVAASRTGAFESMVVPGKTGELVDPGSVDQLVAALAGMMADPQRCRAMGESGRARAIRLFGSEREARAVADVVRSIATGEGTDR